MALPTFYYATGTNYAANFFGIPLGPITTSSGVDRYVLGVNGEIYTWTGGNIDFDPFPLLLDTALWRYQRVTYPASGLDIGGSIQAGVNYTINQIKNQPGPFALGGYSQGASVAMGVYDSLRQGELVSRRADLRAIVTFGSPNREAGHTWRDSSGYSGAFEIPGSTRGSHGLFPNRVQGTEGFVWDFVMPNDVITSVGDSQQGQLWTTAAGFLISNNLALAAASFLGVLGSIAAAAVLEPRGITNLIDVLTGETFSMPGGGHTLYPFLPPPNSDGSIPTSGDTCYQIAAKYLNTVGQQIYDQTNPTVPTPTTRPSYQWFSSLTPG